MASSRTPLTGDPGPAIVAEPKRVAEYDLDTELICGECLEQILVLDPAARADAELLPIEGRPFCQRCTP